MTPEQALKEFDEKLKEVKQDDKFDDDGKTILHEFGYREIENGEIFTVVDWGNIRKFLEASLDKVAREAVREYDKEVFTFFVIDADDEMEYRKETLKLRKSALKKRGIEE